MDCSPPGSSVHVIFQKVYWSELPCPPPGDLPNPGIKLSSSALAGRFFTAEPPGKPNSCFSTFESILGFLICCLTNYNSVILMVALGFVSSTCQSTSKRCTVLRLRLDTQSCPTLCDPMDCNLSGYSDHRIFQARMLEWVAISFSRGIFPTQGSNPNLLCLLH